MDDSNLSKAPEEVDTSSITAETHFDVLLAADVAVDMFLKKPTQPPFRVVQWEMVIQRWVLVSDALAGSPIPGTVASLPWLSRAAENVVRIRKDFLGRILSTAIATASLLPFGGGETLLLTNRHFLENDGNGVFVIQGNDGHAVALSTEGVFVRSIIAFTFALLWRSIHVQGFSR